MKKIDKTKEYFEQNASPHGKQNPNGHLSRKQKHFVDNVVVHGMHYTAAARSAGFKFPKEQARKLMINPKVLKALDDVRDEIRAKSGMTREKVTEIFIEAVDLARIKGDPSAMVQAGREIGRIHGLYEPQKAELSISVDGNVMLHKLNSMSDSELLTYLNDEPNILEAEYTTVEEIGDESE